jgi:hypothetical protein
MDVEKENRCNLISALGDEFECYEEVPVEHVIFKHRAVRPDIVAVPRDLRLSRYALAFEVKRPNTTWNYADWSQAIRQASDYVYGRIGPKAPCADLVGRRIAAVFMFPCPPVDPEGRLLDKGPFVRPDCSVVVTGVFHLALHFRIGRALWRTTRHGQEFSLCFGPNEVWNSRKGFKNQGINLLTGSRTIGSQRMDVAAELDGIG